MTAARSGGGARHYIVTGGSSGIGAAVAGRLAGAGHAVTTIARREYAGDTENVRSLRCDLSNLDRLEAILAPLADGPSPDGVVFCHGRGDFGALEQFSAARIRELVDLNLTSTLMVARLLLPGMKRAGRGVLVLMGSEAALRGARRGVVYCATKFALRGAAQALREECSTSGVRVGIVNPGMVESAFYDHLDFAPGEDDANHLTVEDVADAVLLILDAPAHAVIDEINLSPLKKVVRRT